MSAASTRRPRATLFSAHDLAEAGDMVGVADIFQEEGEIKAVQLRLRQADSFSEAHAEQACAEGVSRCSVLREIQREGKRGD